MTPKDIWTLLSGTRKHSVATLKFMGRIVGLIQSRERLERAFIRHEESDILAHYLPGYIEMLQ